jgi:hypothetical protein
MGEKRTPRRVGEGGKRAVEGSVLILNHVVKCKLGTGISQWLEVRIAKP